MKKMSNYYTPGIEEFYVGFEYEVYIISHPRNGKASTWINFEIKSEEDLIECHNSMSLEGNLDAKYIRVKYLDQEDIESLGFELKGKSIDLWFENEGIYLREDGHHLKNRKLQYGIHDQRLLITFIYTSGEEQIHFDGEIKNKSELKKLLKQLNIK